MPGAAHARVVRTEGEVNHAVGNLVDLQPLLVASRGKHTRQRGGGGQHGIHRIRTGGRALVECVARYVDTRQRLDRVVAGIRDEDIACAQNGQARRVNELRCSRQRRGFSGSRGPTP